MQFLVIGIGIVMIVAGLYFAFGGEALAHSGGRYRNIAIEGPAWLVLVVFGAGVVIFGATHDWVKGVELVAADPGTTGVSSEGSVDATNTSNIESDTTDTTRTTRTTATTAGPSSSATDSPPPTPRHDEPALLPDLLVAFPPQDVPYNCPGSTPSCTITVLVDVQNRGEATSKPSVLTVEAGAERATFDVDGVAPGVTRTVEALLSTSCYNPDCRIVASVESEGEAHVDNNTDVMEATLTYGIDHCMRPYLWRAAFEGDRTCVPAASRDQALADNARAAERVSTTDTTYGPDTCVQGYVWREATPTDHVCVTPDVRQATKDENLLAPCRRVVPTIGSETCA